MDGVGKLAMTHFTLLPFLELLIEGFQSLFHLHVVILPDDLPFPAFFLGFSHVITPKEDFTIS